MEDRHTFAIKITGLAMRIDSSTADLELSGSWIANLTDWYVALLKK